MEAGKLAKRLKELNLPIFRVKQAVRGYYAELLADWSELKVWPKDLRDQFDILDWSPLRLIDVLEADEKDSAKLLFETSDGLKIESVLMRHKDGRNTVCISSQAGCAMGCAFCATGKMGFSRNLTAEEIVDQVVQSARFLKSPNIDSENRNSTFSVADIQRSGHSGDRVTNIVFMGMGEPFNNSDEVFESLRRLMDPEGFGLGARHISISTCGIVPGIQRLAKEAPQVNLAISLHAPTQELRAKIMPVAKAYDLDRLMNAIKDYLSRTNRKVMFEYVMLKGVNDSPEQAEKLADLLVDFPHLAHVNLIKLHRVTDIGNRRSVVESGKPKFDNRNPNPEPRIQTLEPSSQETRRSFANHLKRRGIAVTERVSFGEEIQAACGQLATEKRNV
ncbi:MAG: 23S rRNA (adenine(2503)-C(2))-methyltransferase RlmN [Patescibacteria group bacterium]|nr:23S rRNA (adenine(2503)-C(2))-methyltransferase RlmN [Patescibacteria group bacterium]